MPTERISPVLTERYRFNADLEVESYAFANGLTLLYLPDHSAPVLSYHSWFRVGSRHEKHGKTGMAHLFEHLMFKGTPAHPEGEFDRILEALGGRINAATWLDWTYFYNDVPSAHLEKVVELEADRLQHMLLGAEALEAERSVVMNERRERVDNDPIGKLSEMLWHNAFGAHCYSHPTIGWMSDIEGITSEDCEWFHATYYTPKNLIIVVSGDVERDELLRLIDQYYGSIESVDPPAEQPWGPPALSSTWEEISLPLTGDRLLVGYMAPKGDSPLLPALEILNEILFEGDSSRLQRALITEGELAVAAEAYTPAFTAGGLYEIGIDLRPGVQAEQALQILHETLDAMATSNPPTEAELAKAKNKLETRFYRGLQTVQQRAQGLGFWQVAVGSFKRLFTLAENYAAVTLDDLQTVLREMLDSPEHVVIGRPSGEAPCDEFESDEDCEGED